MGNVPIFTFLWVADWLQCGLGVNIYNLIGAMGAKHERGLGFCSNGKGFRLRFTVFLAVGVIE